MSPTRAPVDLPLRIVSHDSLGSGHFLLSLAIPGDYPAWEPGQFAMVTTGAPEGQADPLLRRPFSIYNTPGDPAGVVQIFYKVLGRGTRLMSGAGPGDMLRCLAPLGNGFAPARSPGTRLLLVAGGIGSASLHPLALRDRESGGRPLMLYGCRTSSEVPGITRTLEAGIEVRLATDDGSAGRRGFVTEMLDELLFQEGPQARDRWVICACGPTPMMRATAEVAARHGVRCHLSLESPMACGFGVCVGCVVGTRETPTAPLRYRRICVEGPVFDSGEVCW
ncbi:MAG TPA: dihydroorotate dehydrogenase electron transfer subunit [Candidatus Polarisedimenticolia bacterium]|jgi:dihydroorotate dehydrogenase electron transfer subunit